MRSGSAPDKHTRYPPPNFLAPHPDLGGLRPRGPGALSPPGRCGVAQLRLQPPEDSSAGIKGGLPPPASVLNAQPSAAGRR